MITSQNRSYYIGASDTNMVIGNWNTKTFDKWWLEKLGIYKNELKTDAMQTGTHYEHKVLDALEIENLEKDKQIIIDRLRVNLDGNTNNCIYEVKTFNSEKEFKVTKQYWRQAQVEMYASKIYKLFIVAYGLDENDYKNFFNNVDKNRIKMFEIGYDIDFIEKEYLPRLEILSQCLKEGAFPCKVQER